MEPHRRKIRFHTRSDKIIFTGFVSLLVGVYFFELLLILPKLEAANENFYKKLHIFFGTVILVNTLLCVWKFMTTDATSGSRVLPSSLAAGWRNCWKCEANAPPRSRHCYICHQCVLLRDHHCHLVSNCVGHATIRYYLMMLGNMWIALLYSNILNMDFVWEVFHTFAPKSLLTMFVPWLAWLLGITESESFFMAIFTSVCVLGFLYCTIMLYMHIRNLSLGRTMFEVQNNCGYIYDLGLHENIRHVFGVNWKYSWICPLISSPLPGDGVTFKQREFIQSNGKGL